jgi:ribonuclease HI
MAADLRTSISQPDRLFNPTKIWGFGIDPFLAESPTGMLTHVGCHASLPCEACCRLPAHLNTLVIAVDGACRSNGRQDATPQSALGVFVGHNSPYNFQHKLPQVRTNQAAELTAGIWGLKVAKNVIENEGQGVLDTVVIKADSEYLVKGMTEWVVKWQANGWKTAKGGDVVNRVFFEELMAEVEELEDAGVKVLFWHVRRGFNREADRLANLALDG